MRLRALVRCLMVACLGFVLSQAGAAYAMPAGGHAEQTSMSGSPCPDQHDSSASQNCPLICPLSCFVMPSAVDARRNPHGAAVRFDKSLAHVSSVRLAPDDPPPRAGELQHQA